MAEAIIGTAYLTGGREAGLGVCRTLRLIPLDPPSNGPVHFATWADLGRRAPVPDGDMGLQLRAETIQEIEELIGHGFTFGSKTFLLAQALVSKN